MFVCVRLRQDWEAGARELGRLKERHLEQAVKYSRALEEQRKASTREKELLTQVTHTQANEYKQTNTSTVKLLNSFSGIASTHRRNPPINLSALSTT